MPQQPSSGSRELGVAACDCQVSAAPAKESLPLASGQRAARGVAGLAFLALALTAGQRLPLLLGRPVAALAGWFAAAHLIAAATRYPGCPELGAIPSLTIGRPIETRCGPWGAIDHRLGLVTERSADAPGH